MASRRVTVTLTAAEINQLWMMADNSWETGCWISDYLKGAPAAERRAAERAYYKLTAARQTANGGSHGEP